MRIRRAIAHQWLTVEEFAAMIGREPKTILNWVGEGRLQFADICGVKLVSMRLIETLITGCMPEGAGSEKLALQLMGRMAPDGTRVGPETRKRRKAVASIGGSRLSVSKLPENTNE